MSFFTSGSVNTQSFNRDKLPVGVYLCAATDFADYVGAPKGNRTQMNFTVVEGCVPAGTKGSHVVSHKYAEAWQEEKARGEIASMLGSLFGFDRQKSGLKVDGPFFEANTRTVTQDPRTGDTKNVTRAADELPIYGKQFVLVVSPYFDKKTGKRKNNPTTGQASVVYEILPVAGAPAATPKRNVVADTAKHRDDLMKTEAEVVSANQAAGQGSVPPGAPGGDGEAADPLDRALADGWKRNGDSAYYYKRGEATQLKAEALRAKYAA